MKRLANGLTGFGAQTGKDYNPVMSRFRVLAFLAAPLSALVLAGCNGDMFNSDGNEVSSVSSAGARHLIVGDEPFAVRTGAEVLAQGGSAVDAATAMFFALSVTYPVAAGLGGGGICVVRDAAGGLTEFDFLPRAASRGGAYAVPAAVRGFAEMQRRFGVLPWQRTVSGAEALADAGVPISQALAARLAGTESIIRLDAALSAQFLDESGQLKPVGTMLRNPALARTLSVVRQNGADGFTATIGAQITAYAAAQGGAIEPSDLAASTVRAVQPARRTLGQFTVVYPNTGTGAGAFSAALLSGVANAMAANANATAIAAARQALASFNATSVPADFGSTGFAVLDSQGAAVSCAVTLNGPFGAGRTVTDTGMQLAAAPSGPSGLASAFLMPIIAVGDGNTFIGAAAGGPNGSAALAGALVRAARGARVATATDLQTTGAAPRDTINVISCQGACVALPDPGASGLGSTGDRAQLTP
jgi:gamma-glutamyltranspeptidase/glutathione hydrolase